MDRYERSMLDMLCLTGEVGWARLSAETGEERLRRRQASVETAGASPAARARLIGSTPVALFLREHGDSWRILGVSQPETDQDPAEPLEALSEPARAVYEAIRSQGASFLRDLERCAVDREALVGGVGELVAAGLATSDGFDGLRTLVRTAAGHLPHRGVAAGAGRWSLVSKGHRVPRELALETQALSLLRRYGVMFRRLLTREANAAPWRELVRVYRRLEARGEIRGGRFVSGMSGEQFALPDAVERLREVRRTEPDGRAIVISAADPLNLAGIVTAGDRVRAVAASRIAYRNGVPIAAREGGSVRPLADDPSSYAEAATALALRRPPTAAIAQAFGPVGPRQTRPS
jgi:ATP-dependent Lhr-like helicase